MDSIEKDSSDTSTTTSADTVARPHDVAIDTQAAAREREARERGAAQGSQIEQVRQVGGDESVAMSVAHGGGGRPRRLLLIGLDGAAPELAIGAWRTDLRSIQMITNRGVRGRIRSGLPCASLPAWLGLLSGLDPGQLGVYGARRRPNHSYAPPVPPDSRDIHEPRLWDILGAAGRRVGVVGAPATTPAPHVRGHLVGDRTIGGALAVHPPALAPQVAGWLEDTPPTAPATDDPIDQIVGDAYARTERRFRLARRLLARGTYDCFVVCDDGLAAIQRLLWYALDVTHPRYLPGHPFKDAISAFYRFVDDQIGELLELVDDDTIVAVASACGAQALDGELALNDWLIAQGELALRVEPLEPAPLEACEVDWERTRAWAGDDGAIYLNVAGREPQGIVPPAEADQLVISLASRLRDLQGPEGASGGEGPAVVAYRPEAIYSAARGVAPDLLAVCARPGWRASALVGRGGPWVSTRAAAMDAACESPNGFFAIYDPHNLGGGRELEDASVYDIAPTLLALLGQPIPARMRGHALLEP